MASKKHNDHYTDYFGITDKKVPFEDLDVHNDTRLFLDPHLVRLRTSPRPYWDQAVKCLDTFLETLTVRVLSRNEDPGDLLKHIQEPPETHLGMARHGYRGHAASDVIAQRIWESLTTDLYSLFRVGLLEHIEDLPLFVRGIDRDITSDITTRVIFDPLAQFTMNCMRQIPELSSRGTIQIEKTVWDPSHKQWTQRTYTVPKNNDGSGIILIPTGWVRKRLLGSASRFLQTETLTYIQHSRAQYDHRGKLVTPSKKTLRKELAKEPHQANIFYTEAAKRNRQNLIAQFWQYVDERYTEKSPDLGDGLARP